MVGRQEHQHVVFAHVAVEETQQRGNLPVEAEVIVLHLNGIGPELVADVVGRGVAEGQKVGHVAFAQLLRPDRLQGKLGGEGVAEGGAGQHTEGIAANGRQVVGEHRPLLTRERFFPGHVVGGALGVLLNRQ